MVDEVLCTPAWLPPRTKDSWPGVLELVDDRIAFTIIDGRVFDSPLAEVDEVTFPWRDRGGVVRIRIGQAIYRVSFVRPADALLVPTRLTAHVHGPISGDEVLRTKNRLVSDVGTGRKAGKAWKSLLLARWNAVRDQLEAE